MLKLFSKVVEGFLSLRGSPKELWLAYILKFCDSFSYFGFSYIFTLFLSEDFGYSDVKAGSLYGIWGALITVYGLITGFLVDNLGVARSLQLGFLMSLMARVVIFWTTDRTVLLLMVCGLLPLGNCLGIPVLTTGIRRYTNEQNRGFAYGLFYVVMNVAALASGPVVDFCTIVWGRNNESAEEDNSESTLLQYENDDDNDKIWVLSGYRMVILSGIVTNVLAVIVAFAVREIKIESTSYNNNNKEFQSDGLERLDSFAKPVRKVAAFTPIQGDAISILKETFSTKGFWRFLAVCLITLNVRMIFRHLDATLPKYMLREFGPNVPKGTIYSINPALIIILVPLVTAATSKVDPLVMIHVGSYVSAASVFFLAFSTSIGASIAFVTLLSIGEAIWSPRLYDYTMSVCPEGREGTYMALSSAPLFLAKLPVGFISGKLLELYCPAEGERNSKLMWLIIGLATASSPVLLTIFWNYISYRDENEKELKKRSDSEPSISTESVNSDEEEMAQPCELTRLTPNYDVSTTTTN